MTMNMWFQSALAVGHLPATGGRLSTPVGEGITQCGLPDRPGESYHKGSLPFGLHARE